MKINRIEATKLDMPYKKPLVTATNNFTIARGLLVKAVDAVNTGIAKVGSSGEVRKIAELCEMNGIRCALSNTAGSMVGDAAALHLAVSTPGIAPLCELGEFEVITGDPFFGLTVDKGAISVPEGEGLGVSLRGF